MTKVIIQGKQLNEKKELKPIEFVHEIIERKIKIGIYNASARPSEWKNIELISKGIDDNFYDIMYCYNNDKSTGILYFGHFNDGVVE